MEPVCPGDCFKVNAQSMILLALTVPEEVDKLVCTYSLPNIRCAGFTS